MDDSSSLVWSVIKVMVEEKKFTVRDCVKELRKRLYKELRGRLGEDDQVRDFVRWFYNVVR